MITKQTIRNYIESRTGLLLNTKTRTNDYVFARCVYAKLCRDYIKVNDKKIPKLHISKDLEINHATLIHSLNNIFPNLESYSPEHFELYNNFFNEFNKPKKTYNELLKENETLNNEINELKSNIINDINFNEILDSVPKDKLELFYFRIKPIAKMLNSHITN